MSLYKLSLVFEILILVLFLPDEVNQSIIIRSVDFDYPFAIPVSHYYCMDECIFCLQLLTVELSHWLYFVCLLKVVFLIDIGFYIIFYFYYNCCVCVLSCCFMQSTTPVYLPFSCCWQCIFRIWRKLHGKRISWICFRDKSTDITVLNICFIQFHFWLNLFSLVWGGGGGYDYSSTLKQGSFIFIS